MIKLNDVRIKTIEEAIKSDDSVTWTFDVFKDMAKRIKKLEEKQCRCGK